MQRLNLTLSRTQSSGRWDHGERWAAVHRAQIVLHVGADVGVRRAERWFTRPGRRVGRQTDEGNIWDDWTARQSWRSAERKKKYMFSSVKERWKMKWREDEHHRQKTDRWRWSEWRRPVNLITCIVLAYHHEWSALVCSQTSLNFCYSTKVSAVSIHLHPFPSPVPQLIHNNPLLFAFFY